MGYVLKTTFWLGLVLAAMPLGETPKVSDFLTPAQQAAACGAASEALAAKIGGAVQAYRGLAAMGCASLAAPAPAAASPRALNANDRKPAWLPPPARPRPG